MAAKGKKVFISYRREDAGDISRLIRESLVQTGRIAREDIFMDVTAILPGANFMQVIGDTISQCRTVIVVISPSWLAQVNAPDTSYVRAEAEIALEKGIPVIPVLVGGAKLPSEEQLPEKLRVLTRLNVQPIRHETFDYDMGQVRKALQLGSGRRGGWVAAIAAALLVALSLGVLTQVPPGHPLLPWPFPPQAEASATATTPATFVSPTVTPTTVVSPTPALTIYTTNTPGPACDSGGATWIAVAGAFSCGGNATSIAPSSTVANLRFDWPGHPFGSVYTMAITISLDKGSCTSVVTNVTAQRGVAVGYWYTACGSGYECIGRHDGDAANLQHGLICGTWSDGPAPQVSTLALTVHIAGPVLTFSVGVLATPSADVPARTSTINASDATYTATDYTFIQVYSPSSQATLTKFSCSIPSA